MDRDLIVNLENHRTRDRIKDMGEVFTPEQYVQELLTILDSSVWSDENTIFFEPTCGHGNIVVPIIMKRINALERKYVRQRIKQPSLHAIANALNTIWAIDICSENIELTRTRVMSALVGYYLESGDELNIGKARDFWSHILCTIKWQIHENEALSALTPNVHGSMATSTKLGKTWISKNGHKPIDFTNDWASHYTSNLEMDTIPQMFLRALRFFDASIESPAPRGFDDFNFAKNLLHQTISGARARKVA